MTILPVDAIGDSMPTAFAMPPVRAAQTDFASALGDGLIQVDRSLRAADDRLRSLAAGENVALHDVMITMERARMDLMLVVEVRNRLLEAYQELTRMQL